MARLTAEFELGAEDCALTAVAISDEITGLNCLPIVRAVCGTRKAARRVVKAVDGEMLVAVRGFLDQLGFAEGAQPVAGALGLRGRSVAVYTGEEWIAKGLTGVVGFARIDWFANPPSTRGCSRIDLDAIARGI